MLYQPCRRLRSSGSRLQIPRFKTKHGEAPFSFYIPLIRNKHPQKTTNLLKDSVTLNQWLKKQQQKKPICLELPLIPNNWKIDSFWSELQLFMISLHSAAEIQCLKSRNNPDSVVLKWKTTLRICIADLVSLQEWFRRRFCVVHDMRWIPLTSTKSETTKWYQQNPQTVSIENKAPNRFSCTISTSLDCTSFLIALNRQRENAIRRLNIVLDWQKESRFITLMETGRSEYLSDHSKHIVLIANKNCLICWRWDIYS